MPQSGPKRSRLFTSTTSTVPARTAIVKPRDYESKGELSAQIRLQAQARRIEGMAEFEQYREQRFKSQTLQSIMTIAEQEAQEIIDRHTGTGTTAMQKQKDGVIIAVWDAEESDDEDDSMVAEADSSEIKFFDPDEIESIKVLSED